MAVDSIVRVSFQSRVRANKAVNNALVGHPQNDSGSGPYKRVGTALYSCNNESDATVIDALSDLLEVIEKHKKKVDFISITLVHK